MNISWSDAQNYSQADDTTSSNTHDDSKDERSSTNTTITTSTTTVTAMTMSKSQRKRIQKRERLQQAKLEKKRQEKETKRMQAISAGRNLEAERQIVLERTLAGDRQRRFTEIWESRIQEANYRFQLCIDCSYEESMTERELASLAQQIRYCYSYNKNSPNPCLVAVTSLTEGGLTRSLLEKETGFLMWHKRAFICTEMSLPDYYCFDLENNHDDTCDKTILSRFVYLTSDSTNTLNHLQDDKIYVIGGIVDRNRLKRVAMTRAEQLGVATAKLPLDDYLSKMPSTRVLTCNHVFDILLKYRESGNDWSLALQQVLPNRKEAKFHGIVTGTTGT